MLLVATVLSAVVAYILGALWYSPLAFAGSWQKAVHRRPEDLQSTPGLFVKTAMLWIVAAIGFTLITLALGVLDMAGFFALAVFGWATFTMPQMGMVVLFQDRTPALLWIDGGYHLTAMLAMALIHSLCR